MPIIKHGPSRKHSNDIDLALRARDRDAEPRKRRDKDRYRERDSSVDDIQRDRVEELIRLLQKKKPREETEESETETEEELERRREEDKLDRAAEAIQSNKGNYYANTRRLWELDKEISPYICDPELKKLLNEKMKRTIQYFLDTYLFSKTNDPMRHLDNFCAKYTFIE